MEPVDTTPEEDDLLSSEEEYNIYTQDIERTAKNLAHFLGIEQERAALDNIVFSLEQSLADAQAGNTIDFTDMLTKNSRILNAAFEFYLDKAKDSKSPDQKINLAFKAHGQLIRTINTWTRLVPSQNGGTK